MVDILNDEYFMRLALNEAKEAFNKGEIPVGAVVVAAGKVISRAYNQTELLNDVTAHAEMLAITAASSAIGGKYLQDCTLYVTLEPCQMCIGAMFWAKLGKLVYAAKDPKRGFTKLSAEPHQKTEIVSGIMEKQAQELLNDFFRKLR